MLNISVEIVPTVFFSVPYALLGRRLFALEYRQHRGGKLLIVTGRHKVPIITGYRVSDSSQVESHSGGATGGRFDCDDGGLFGLGDLPKALNRLNRDLSSRLS